MDHILIFYIVYFLFNFHNTVELWTKFLKTLILNYFHIFNTNIFTLLFQKPQNSIFFFQIHVNETRKSIFFSLFSSKCKPQLSRVKHNAHREEKKIHMNKNLWQNDHLQRSKTRDERKEVWTMKWMCIILYRCEKRRMCGSG